MRSKKGYKRSERVAKLITQILSERLFRGDLHDQRLRGIVFTRTSLSDDLRNATIFYRTTDLEKPGPADTIQAALERASNLFRQELHREMVIKNTPQLRFKYDESVEVVDRIEQILNQIGPIPEHS